MDVSIIIVNYNSSGLIIECLKTIYSKTKDIDFEIIIVDNNSEKDIQSKIEKYNLNTLNIKYVLLNENIGFGRANNEGYNISTGRNILCLNPDTLLLNNAVKILSDFLDSNDTVGACGGNLYDCDGKSTISFRRILPGLLWEINALCLCLFEHLIWRENRYFNNSNKPINVGYVVGADLMVKRSVIEEIGFFSPDFFMYYEETDLCFRINKVGYKIQAIPDSKIIHLEGKTFGPKTCINQQKIKIQEISKFTYISRNCTPFVKNLCYKIYGITLSITPYIYYFLGRKYHAKELFVRKKILKQCIF